MRVTTASTDSMYVDSFLQAGIGKTDRGFTFITRYQHTNIIEVVRRKNGICFTMPIYAPDTACDVPLPDKRNTSIIVTECPFALPLLL